jgi:hypothetical protein
MGQPCEFQVEDGGSVAAPEQEAGRLHDPRDAGPHRGHRRVAHPGLDHHPGGGDGGAEQHLGFGGSFPSAVEADMLANRV